MRAQATENSLTNVFCLLVLDVLHLLGSVGLPEGPSRYAGESLTHSPDNLLRGGGASEAPEAWGASQELERKDLLLLENSVVHSK